MQCCKMGSDITGLCENNSKNKKGGSHFIMTVHSSIKGRRANYASTHIWACFPAGFKSRHMIEHHKTGQVVELKRAYKVEQHM